MESPFPGMDPYLEASSIWSDVHASLITAIRDQIQADLNQRYTAMITLYVAFESIEIAPVRRAVPDIDILECDSPAATGDAVAIAPPPLTGIAAMEVPTRYGGSTPARAMSVALTIARPGPSSSFPPTTPLGSICACARLACGSDLS